MKRYDRAEDVQMRLNGTICRYKGEPVYIETVGSLTVNCVNLLNMKSFKVDSNEDDLDISSPPLGYVNLGVEPMYASRSTARVQQQGLSLENLIFIRPDGEAYEHRSAKVRDYAPMLGMTIANRYPTFSEARDSLNQAFHRRMAFSKFKGIPVLLYRGEIAGYYSQEKNEVVLSPKMKVGPVLGKVQKYMKVSNG